jgi:hypothetical protein
MIKTTEIKRVVTGDMFADERIDHAFRRLDQAATLLEQRLARSVAAGAAAAGGAMDLDRARLAAELDAARSRELALEAAGAEASAALAQAIHALEQRLEQAGKG